MKRDRDVHDGDRDRAVERLLREAAGSDSDSACLDAERLAAWSAGRLPAAQGAIAERHLSDCARCQAMLAAFVRTEPAATATVSGARWGAWHLRWLVPVAAAATVAGIWVATPRPDSVRESGERVVAQRASGRGEESPQAPASDESTRLLEAPLARDGAGGDRRQQEQTNEVIVRSVPPADSADRPAGAGSERDRPVATVPQRPVGETAQTDACRERATASRLPTRAEPPVAVAPPAADTTRAAAPRTEELSFTATSPVIEIASPDSPHRWRIVGGLGVEHSSTGGARWEAVAVALHAPLQAGHSPSMDVVWLVGRDGTVYAGDGSRLERVPFPEPVDLLAVRALNAREATVTASDGRRFHTADGGATWTPVP